MNLTKVAAFIVAIVVLVVTLLTSTDNPMAFVDYHGILIVIGGTISATAISFQFPKIIVMLKIFWQRSVLGRNIDFQETIKNIIALANSYSSESPDFRNQVAKMEDPFMREAFEALADSLVEPDHLYRIMKRRANTMHDQYQNDAMRFKAIGKYPPAMGLLGAVTGMIALLASLGKPGVEQTIGPAMSVALVATMYGIALANFFIIPIGDALGEYAKEVRMKNLIICEGLRLASSGMNSLLLAEELNSFLLPSERVDWKAAG